MKEYQARVESTLDHWIPKESIQPSKLHHAMRYSVLSGGKRVRPFFVYASGHALNIDLGLLDGPAAAVELIHAYSLIHDDLPAMDDDDLRRGQPTCHNKFDEATAILAGDAIQSLAFQILSKDKTMLDDPMRRCQMIENLAIAIGSRGMAGGQAMDLAAEGLTLSLAELEELHIHKTGALIRASIQLAMLSAPNHNPEQLKQLDRYAKYIGLAFQVKDDILDIEADTETLGKPQGSDQKLGKSTYPSLLGMPDAKRMARELLGQALDCLTDFADSADPLRWMAHYVVERNH